MAVWRFTIPSFTKEFEPSHSHQSLSTWPSVVSNLKIWWHPPTIPGPDFKSKPVALSPTIFLLFWLPRKMWSFDLKSPKPNCSDHPFLTSRGLYIRVRNVIDLVNRYYIGAECLEIRSCGGTFISYYSRLIAELCGAYQVSFRFYRLGRSLAIWRSCTSCMREHRKIALSPCVTTNIRSRTKTGCGEKSLTCRIVPTIRNSRKLTSCQYDEQSDFKSQPTPKWYLATYIHDVWAHLP